MPLLGQRLEIIAAYRLKYIAKFLIFKFYSMNYSITEKFMKILSQVIFNFCNFAIQTVQLKSNEHYLPFAYLNRSQELFILYSGRDNSEYAVFTELLQANVDVWPQRYNLPYTNHWSDTTVDRKSVV